MTKPITASDMARLSREARIKKHGGPEGFREEMRRLAKLPRPGRKRLSTEAPLVQ